MQILKFQWYLLTKTGGNIQFTHKKQSTPKGKIAFCPSTEAKPRAHFGSCFINLLSYLICHSQPQKQRNIQAGNTLTLIIETC